MFSRLNPSFKVFLYLLVFFGFSQRPLLWYKLTFLFSGKLSVHPKPIRNLLSVRLAEFGFPTPATFSKLPLFFKMDASPRPC
jgi:hypothetical protein